MSTELLPPPLTPADALVPRLQSAGFAVLDGGSVCQLAGIPLDALQALTPDWDALPPDPHLKDGGRYRCRRHGSFVLDEADVVHDVPHRAHWQPVAYNALHGGMARWFEAISADTAGAPAWRQLLSWLGRVADGIREPQLVQAGQGTVRGPRPVGSAPAAGQRPGQRVALAC